MSEIEFKFVWEYKEYAYYNEIEDSIFIENNDKFSSIEANLNYYSLEVLAEVLKIPYKRVYLGKL